MTFKRFALILLLLVFSSTLHAQRFNQKQEYEGLRDGTWEASLLIGSQDSLEVSGDNGSSAKFDSELAWGFSVGWNWTPRWNFAWKFMLPWALANLLVTVVAVWAIRGAGA